MLGAARWALVPALMAGCLLLPGTALAINPQVHDHGKFFDADTIRKADADIKRIEQKYKIDVVVETYDKIPEDLLSKFGYKENDRDTFFKRWIDDLADRAGVNGIVIILSKDQFKADRVRVEVGVGRETQKKKFTLSNRDELYRMLKEDIAAGLKEKNPKKFNEALLDGIRYIENTLSSHKAESVTPAVVPPRSAPVHHDDTGGSNILGWICIGLCVLVGIWLIFGLIRAFSGGGYAGGGPGYAGGYGGGGYGGGGGGFFPGLLGGLFGGMAGMWLYNNMFGGGGLHQGGWESSAHAGQSTGGNDNAPTDEGQGFSSTGGDVDGGGGGGGGDVDGGDAGGGGGGDWGGGGGDWGGGGDAGGGGGGDWGGGGDAGGGGGDWGGGGGGGDFGGGGGGGDW
jgi:uncharacterized membrane protein YgcG